MPNALSRFTPEGDHIFAIRVYYEDTDTAGIVYYANYLKFAERARTEVLRDLGISQRVLFEEQGVAFAVRRCEVDYLAPARLDDELEVRTTLRALGAASVDLDQTVRRSADQRELARLVVRLAVINRDGRPTRLPPHILDVLRPLATKGGGTVPAARRSVRLQTTANKKRA